MAKYYKKITTIFAFLLFYNFLLAHTIFSPVGIIDKVTELKSEFIGNIDKLNRDTIPNFLPYPSTPNAFLQQQCEFNEISYDSLLGKTKKDLQYEALFSYTPEKLKPYLKSEELVTAYGKLTSLTGGYKYLTLKIEVKGSHSNNNYGKIKKGSMLNINLLKGKAVVLYSTNEANGIYHKESNTYLYTVIYPFDTRQQKLLNKQSIDVIWMVWESGYESYPIYNTSFFQQQLACLNKKL